MSALFLTKEKEIYTNICRMTGKLGALIEIGPYHCFGMFHKVYNMDKRLEFFKRYLEDSWMFESFLKTKFLFVLFDNEKEFTDFVDEVNINFVEQNLDCVIRLDGFNSNGEQVHRINTVRKDNPNNDWVNPEDPEEPEEDLELDSEDNQSSDC